MIPDFRRAAILARWMVALVAAPLVSSVLGAQLPTALSDSAFAQLSASLSEPPGFFDTDNLISNEDAYLHPVGTLKRIGVTGGAYVGVGPDQNFSYIAAIHPHIAFLIDIRRDNLLEHLLFKAIFAQSRNRLEYLCLLFGKRAPTDTTGWGARDGAALLAYIDAAPSNSTGAADIQSKVIAGVRKLAMPLSIVDLATIARFHSTFIAQGPALRFNTLGRPPASYDPDYRRLLLETDRTGRQSNFLAHEADFQVVKSLEGRNLVIPVVGKSRGEQGTGGDRRLAAIAPRNSVRLLHVERRAVPVRRRHLPDVRAHGGGAAPHVAERDDPELFLRRASAGGGRLSRRAGPTVHGSVCGRDRGWWLWELLRSGDARSDRTLRETRQGQRSGATNLGGTRPGSIV